MDTPPLAALALAALMTAGLAGTIPTAAAAATCSSAALNEDPSCSFLCEAGQAEQVSMTSSSGGEVTGKATCPASTAGPCHSWGTCTAFGPPSGSTNHGSCEGWAANGDGTVTCSGGRDVSGQLHGLMSCDPPTYQALGLASLTVIFVSPDPFIQGGSYSWTPGGGCLRFVPDCHRVLNTYGRHGVLCGIGPQFYWASHS